jgi:ribosomal protein S18 acetylase RimI-like enzyme
MSIEIQRARSDQAHALTLIVLAAKAHWGYPRRWLEIWKPQLAITPDFLETNESWAAVENGTPIGFYTLQEKNGKGWIENLWVLPEFIGRGVGKLLFLHAANLSRERAYRTLQLEADPNAAGFYSKMGMFKVGERPTEVDGQPRILPIMELDL